MADAVYSILSTLTGCGATIVFCYFAADGLMASMVHENYKASLKEYEMTGDKSILERHKETISKADPHNVTIFTRRAKKGILKEINHLCGSKS
jgi:hypothetical protein